MQRTGRFCVCLKPVTNNRKGLTDIVAMSTDILPGDIRTKHLVAVLIAVENQTGLAFLKTAAKLSCAQKNSQLEGHVEPG